MDFTINRLDPNIPDPVESRRRAAGRVVRITYATTVFGILGFFVIYFGSPFVYLSGPGTVTSPRYVISLPYTVRVTHVDVAAGDAVKAGDQIAQVRSYEQDQLVATYLRALADLAGRTAELRIQARVAQSSLEAARNYKRLANQAVRHVETSSHASMTYRVEIFRERALADRTVASQEAEVAESVTQLADLDKMILEIRKSLDSVQRSFAEGRLSAPIPGIVAANPAYIGQSLVAGTPIVEVLDPTDVFVDWYIPYERHADPKVGQQVLVLFGSRRIPGKISEILPVSAVYAGTSLSERERIATPIARIHFDPGTSRPPLNATVSVHMFYTEFAARVAGVLTYLFGLR
jgi:multidrug resistance efflux pump